MKKNNLNRFVTTVLMGVAIVSTSSCVDESYDLSQIDKTAVILKGASMPIGNLSPISISDFLNTEEGESVLQADADGNFFIAFDGGAPISASFTIPKLNLAVQENTLERRTISMVMPSVIAGLSIESLQTYLPSYYDKKMTYEELNGSPISIKKTVQVAEEVFLSHYIGDIKELELDSDITYKFSLKTKDASGNYTTTYGGSVYVEKGFIIDFPDWLMISKNDDLDCYVIENQTNNKNVIRFTKDLAITIDKPVTFNIHISKIEIPAGFIVNGGKDSEGHDCKKLNIDTTEERNMILIDGNAYTKASDYRIIPKEVAVDMDLSFKDFDVKSALVSLNLNETLSDQSFTMSELPELFTKEGIVIDIYDPSITFNVDNQTALDINVYSHLYAYRNNQVLTDFYFAENGANSPITIPGNYNGAISFSRRGENGKIALPGIGELFRTLPDELAIKELRITSGSDYITLSPGDKLECSVDYSFEAPLAFGSDLAIDLEYEIAELELELDEVNVTEAELSFDIVNTIPLSLEVESKVMTEEGFADNGITISVQGDVKAGSLKSPSTSKIAISLKNNKGTTQMNGLKLILKASCPSDYQGIAINKNQGIEIRNLCIALPEGVELNIDDILDLESEE